MQPPNRNDRNQNHYNPYENFRPNPGLDGNARQGRGPGRGNVLIRGHMNDLGRNAANNAVPNVRPQNGQGQNRAGETHWQKFTRFAAGSALAANMPLNLWLSGWARNGNGRINKTRAFIAVALIDENWRSQQNAQNELDTNPIRDFAEKLLKESDDPEVKKITVENNPPDDSGYYSDSDA